MNLVGQADIDICRMQCIFRNGCPCDEDVFELAVIYMAEGDLEQPTNAREALDLYPTLRTCLVRDHVSVWDFRCLFKCYFIMCEQ